jgi:hypothetical protein
MNTQLLWAVSILLCAQSASAQQYADMRKGTLELPTARLLKKTDVASATSSGGAANRTVSPGLVGWHSDYSAAVKAAKTTRKPVLLFQLMGRLDQEFC